MRPKMGLPSRVTVVGILLLASTAHTWTFMWHDADNKTHIKTGDDRTECAEMSMDEGKVYSYDPESNDEFCLNMFPDSKCEEDKNGWSCPKWGPRQLGQPTVRAWYVSRATESTSTATSASASGSSSTMATSSSSTLSSASATPTDGSSESQESSEDSEDGDGGGGGGSALSGGGIAGVVIGTLAGVVIIAVAVVLLTRRHYAQKQKQGGGPVEAGGGAPKHGDQPPPPPPKGHELDSNVASPMSGPQHPVTPVSGAAQPFPSDTKDPPPGYGASNRQHVSELPDNSVPQEMEAR